MSRASPNTGSGVVLPEINVRLGQREDVDGTLATASKEIYELKLQQIEGGTLSNNLKVRLAAEGTGEDRNQIMGGKAAGNR